MKAIIQIDVPNYQLGQEVSIYFKDTMMIKGIVQELSGDLISRQTVLKIIDGWYDNNRDAENIEDLIVLITYMDPVNPQKPKTGHWSHDGSHWKNRFICSECGYKLFEEPTNYCPNCGARMESEEV